MSFHIFDTINTRTKVHHKAISSSLMFSQIWRKQGVYGLTKGISATFYGSIINGFVYFSFYKKLKQILIPSDQNEAQASFFKFFSCSIISQIVTLLFYYPFDLIKSRIQTRNQIYKYKNLPHAFRSVVYNQGHTQLYKGGGAYMIMYGFYVPLQFACYETIMQFLIQKFPQKAKSAPDGKPVSFVVFSSVVAGGIAAFLTNPFQTITAHQQVHSQSKSILEVIRKQKFGLLYRGIGVRTSYMAFQSILLFMMIDIIGKIYNIDLTGID